MIHTNPIDTALLALGAFAGTNLDNLIALGGQFAVVDKKHHRRIAEGQLMAIVLVIGLCAAVGSVVESAPHRVLGLLGLIPIALGIRAFVILARRSPADPSVPPASGFFSSLGVTLALSGDNVAVYLPILAIGGLTSGTVAVATWLAADLALIGVALSIASHPKVRSGMDRVGPLLLPIVYLVIGLVVMFRAQTL